jgi:quercetin dioxygenase-like cupin family protein
MPALTFAPTLAAISRHYELRGKTADALGRELALVLSLLPGETAVVLQSTTGTPHPITRHLETALAPAKGRVEDVLAPLRRIAAALPWRYSYTPRADAPGLEHRVAWAEFVGPVAPIPSDEVCLGVTLIAPHTLYPLHRHPAVETYFVLSGTATWTAAGHEQPQPPGTLILHPANVDHAMQTGAEPLLAVYTWTGDVHSSSVYSA